jgi:predicted nucleic acid-binding Zn ribbon protein
MLTLQVLLKSQPHGIEEVSTKDVRARVSFPLLGRLACVAAVECLHVAQQVCQRICSACAQRGKEFMQRAPIIPSVRTKKYRLPDRQDIRCSNILAVSLPQQVQTTTRRILAALTT